MDRLRQEEDAGRLCLFIIGELGWNPEKREGLTLLAIGKHDVKTLESRDERSNLGLGPKILCEVTGLSFVGLLVTQKGETLK